MIERAALMSVVLLACLAAPVLAQTPVTAGSLTIMSRPSGASFRLVGDQSVVGRTPMTLDRGLVGSYRVTGSDIGYERWKRSITLDGYAADTLWMTLKQKSGAMAGLRSLIVPGWGQFYDDHPGRGTLFLTAAIAAGVGYVVLQDRYGERKDELNLAAEAYETSGTPEDLAALESAQSSAEDAREKRQIAMIAAGVVYGLALVDAVAFVPRPVGPVLLGARTGLTPGLRSRSGAGGSGGPGVTVTLAQMKF